MKHFNHWAGIQFNIGGASVYYEIIRNPAKPVILFLHGGGGDIEDFNPILPGFADDYHIIGIDSRGHGSSTTGLEKLTYKRLQEDAELVLTSLKISRVSIIGSGDGGIVGYRMAVENVVQVDRLVTIGSTWSWRDVEDTKDILQNFTAERWQDVMPESFLRRQKLNSETDVVAILENIKAMWIDETPEGYPNDAVETISCPTLIIRGDSDRMFSRKSACLLADKIKHAKLFNIPFADHLAFTEQQEIFMQILKQFLDEQDHLLDDITWKR